MGNACAVRPAHETIALPFLPRNEGIPVDDPSRFTGFTAFRTPSTTRPAGRFPQTILRLPGSTPQNPMRHKQRSHPPYFPRPALAPETHFRLPIWG